jgi:hypothetical protein
MIPPDRNCTDEGGGIWVHKNTSTNFLGTPVQNYWYKKFKKKSNSNLMELQFFHTPGQDLYGGGGGDLGT